MTNLAINQLVAECRDEAKGIVGDAVEIMFSRVVSDPAIMKENLSAMVRCWCQSQIGSQTGASRKRIWSREEEARPTHDAKASAKGNRLAGAISNALMELPLPGGQRLGDATRDDLEDSVQHYGQKAKDAAWKARFLRRVKDSLGNHHRVSDVLTETDLQRLQNEAGKSDIDV